MLKLLILALPLVFGTNAEAVPPVEFSLMGEGFNDNSMADNMNSSENEEESMAAKEQQQGENNA